MPFIVKPKSEVPKSRPKGKLKLKVLIVKVAQNDSLDSSSQKNLPGGQGDQGRGGSPTCSR